MNFEKKRRRRRVVEVVLGKNLDMILLEKKLKSGEWKKNFTQKLVLICLDSPEMFAPAPDPS